MQIMIEQLITYFEKHLLLNDEEKVAIRENIIVQKITKNTILLNEGKVSKAFYFIFDGCIRMFYNTEREEKTAFFYIENMFVSSYESFTKQIPAKHNFQAIEDTTLAVISQEAAGQLLAISPKFEILARIMMEEELIIYQEIISSFITLNAEQRYQLFLKNHPDLLQRIPQYYLASFLGVSAETLSRIRKRISLKNIS